MADPTGILINIAIQAVLRLAIAALTPKQNTEGPRLEDTSYTTSTYGKPISIGYGTVLLSGNVIWGRDIREEAEVINIGKGNPFSLGTETLYTYWASLAIGIAEREAAALIRIYADGKLIMATDNTATTEEMLDLTYRFYKGGEFQQPDPLIAEDFPEGQVPAYRGMCYIVINDLPLENFGNRIPQFQFVVSFEETDGPQLATLMEPSGYPDMTFGTEGELVFDRLRNTVFIINRTETGGPYGISACDADTGALLAFVTFGEMNEYLLTLRTGPDSDFISSGTIQKHGFLAEDPRIMVGGDSPYLILVNDGVGMETHVLLDKATLMPINSTASNGQGVGWVTYDMTIAPGLQEKNNPERGIYSHWDSSGGGLIFPVDEGYTKSWFYVGGSNGDTSARLFDASRTILVAGELQSAIQFDDNKKRGTFGVSRLPNMGQSLFGNHQELNGGSFGIYGIALGKVSIGWTDVYFLSAIEDVTDPNFQVVRMRMSASGVASFYACGHDSILGGAVGTTFLDYRVEQGRHHLRYDEDTDVLAIYVYEDNAGSAGDRILLAFNANSGNTEADFQGDLEFIWSRGDLGYNPSAVPTDSQTNSSPDGTILIQTSGAPATYDILYMDSGQLIETIVMPSNSWTTQEGDLVSAGGTQIWDGDRYRYFNTGSANSYGWYYVKPAQARGEETLQTIVEDLMLRTELTADQIDASELATISVKGYLVQQDMSYRAALEPLATAYNFYGVEEDGQIVLRFKTDTPNFSVTSDDMVAANESGRTFFEESRIQDAELPAALYVAYMSGEGDYLDDVSTQMARRSINPNKTMNAVGKVRLELPLTLTDQEAADIATRLLYESWVNQERVIFRLSQEYLRALPNDVITVNASGRVEDIRLERVSISGTLDMELEGTVLDGSVYTINVVPASPVANPNWGRDTVMDGNQPFALGFLFDMPLISDGVGTSGTGALMMFAAGNTITSAGTFRGATIGVSNNDAPFEFRANVTNEMAWGFLRTAVPDIPDPDWNGVQEISLDVSVYAGESSFTSATQADMIGNDANAAILFNPATNTVEHIGFRDVEDVASTGDTRKRLTGFMRGKRGSGADATGYAGQTYIIIADTRWLAGFYEGVERLGNEVDYRVVPAGGIAVSGGDIALTYEHRSLKPYAPSHPTISEGSNGYQIGWTRRTRLSGSWQDYFSIVNVSEDTEIYEIDILSAPGGAVLRTLTATTNSVAYTFDMQDADYGTAFSDEIYVVIYQMSGQVGRGFPRPATLTLE